MAKEAEKRKKLEVKAKKDQQMKAASMGDFIDLSSKPEPDFGGF